MNIPHRKMNIFSIKSIEKKKIKLENEIKIKYGRVRIKYSKFH